MIFNSFSIMNFNSMNKNKLAKAGRIREYIIPIAITLGLLLISLILHVKSCGSPLEMDHDLWEKRINAHLTEYPFKIRLLTTPIVVFMADLLRLPYREVFYALQFLLAAILGPAFYAYLKNLGFSNKISNIGVILLMSSYPIMAAHFEPVHTWDDFWVYLFLVLCFLALFRQKPIWGAILFTLSCFAREQTAIFYPIYAFAFIRLSGKIDWKKTAVLLAFPVIVYGAYFLNVRMPYQYTIFFNFESAIRARDTIFSVFISFGLMWSLLPVALLIQAWQRMTSSGRFLVISSVYSMAVTLIFVLIFGRARKTRLLFPPFVFMIPLSLMIIRPCLDFFYKYTGRTGKIAFILVLIILMAAGIFAAFAVFPEFEFRQCANYCRQWAGINIGLMVSLIFLIITRRKVRELIRDYFSEFGKSDSLKISSEAL